MQNKENLGNVIFIGFLLLRSTLNPDCISNTVAGHQTAAGFHSAKGEMSLPGVEGEHSETLVNPGNLRQSESFSHKSMPCYREAGASNSSITRDLMTTRRSPPLGDAGRCLAWAGDVQCYNIIQARRSTSS